MGHSPWRCKESDTTEQLTLSIFSFFKTLCDNLHFACSFHSVGHFKYLNHFILKYLK